MLRFAIGSGLVKGVFMTALVAKLAAAEPFWHQLVLVFGSAGLTALAVIGSAWLNTRKVEQTIHETHENVVDLKRAAGVDKRETDT